MIVLPIMRVTRKPFLKSKLFFESCFRLELFSSSYSLFCLPQRAAQLARTQDGFSVRGLEQKIQNGITEFLSHEVWARVSALIASASLRCNARLS